MLSIVIVVVIVALMGLQSYFTVGPGRHLTIGNKNHWWNRPMSRNGRRIIGAIVAVVMIGFLIYDLLHPKAYSTFGPAPLKDVFDAIFAALGVLVATGAFPRARGSEN